MLISLKCYSNDMQFSVSIIGIHLCIFYCCIFVRLNKILDLGTFCVCLLLCFPYNYYVQKHFLY